MVEPRKRKSVEPAVEPEDASGLVCDCRECKGEHAHPHKQ